jgi:hypothetical protein
MDKILSTFLTSNATWQRYCDVFRKTIFKTVSGGGTIASTSAYLLKESTSISKATAAASAQVSKFCFHRANPGIKLSHLVYNFSKTATMLTKRKKPTHYCMQHVQCTTAADPIRLYGNFTLITWQNYWNYKRDLKMAHTCRNISS